MSENKTGKYIKYAIGEIVLVVIGILIALQINNWNEAKAGEERFLSVLQEINTDLINDIGLGNFILRNGKKQDSLFLKVLDKEFTAEDYLQNEDYLLFWLGLNYDSFEYQKRGYAKFENFASVVSKKYERLTELISIHYSVTCPSLEASLNNNIERIGKRHDYMAENYSWYNQLQHEARTDEIIDFYINDPIYKNWIFQSYQFSSTGNNTNITALLNGAFEIVIVIYDIIDGKVPVFFAEFYSDFLGKQLTDKEKDVVGTYHRGETGRTFSLEVKAGYLMYNGSRLLKKIGQDKYQSISASDWYYEVVRDESGKIEEFIMNLTGEDRIIKCTRVK